MERKPTIKDVAEHAGVTTGTVSLALNGDKRVSPETRRRIEKVATELGYQADDNASKVGRKGNSDAIRGATIYDVAKKAGVSVSTVSAVINGKEIVHRETKKRVQEAIESLSFGPDTYAQNLGRKLQK